MLIASPTAKMLLLLYTRRWSDTRIEPSSFSVNRIFESFRKPVMGLPPRHQYTRSALTCAKSVRSRDGASLHYSLFPDEEGSNCPVAALRDAAVAEEDSHVAAGQPLQHVPLGGGGGESLAQTLMCIYQGD
mmetsp:Transcript_40015/g.125714  ORF Transcript_40015/g.125714 Transcript_40015/m.125714 type:complete len:131 (-) Transcript_40015:1023-1415(-)